MSADTALILRDFGGVPEITPDAQAVKAAALAAAKKVAQVTTDAELEIAIGAKRSLKNIRTAVEAQRKAIKAPVLALGKAIDETADTFMREIVAEEARQDGFINHFQRQQIEAREREAREAEAKRRKEEADRLAAEAEVRRIEAEAEAARQRAESAKTQAARDKAAAEADALDEKALDASLAAETLAPSAPEPVATVQPKGFSARKVLDFQVLGANEWEQEKSIRLFAAAFPDLCKVEIKRSAVLDRLNRGDAFNGAQVPGIRIFDTIKTTVR